jgi:manganese catalase
VGVLTGADLTKAFPMPRIPTDKIPECRPHLERGSHLTLYRFTRDDYREVAAVFKGTHPETGEELRVVHPAPEGFPWPDAPAQNDVFAPDYATEEIAEIARRLRQRAGFPEPTGAEIRVVDRPSERKAVPGSGA